MMRSMTGFAEKSFEHPAFNLKIGIRTLNHRYLDWNYRGAQIGGLEEKLRGLCQKRLHRGRVDVGLDINSADRSGWEFRINDDLLESILTSLDASLRRLGREMTLSAENLFDIPHVIELKRRGFTREEENFIEDGFSRTLAELIRNREREGRAIRRDLQAHFRNLRTGVKHVARLAARQPELLKRRLKERLKELGVETTGPGEEKFLTEASYLAQRGDLTEEVERLRNHLNYARELSSAKEDGPVGKKLDFLAQELHREVNTINSKAQDIGIIRECLALKNEVESVRQQVQNLE